MIRQLVLDASPLIALLYAKDDYHDQSVRGFEQLQRDRSSVLVPVPIIFEVYKWLLQRVDPKLAQAILQASESSFQLVVIDRADLYRLQQIIQSLPGWQGTLEDATVFLVSQHYRCPVWTLDYRDLGVFKTIEFWNPD